MRKNIAVVLIFIAINILIFFFHLSIFKGSMPYLAWVSGFVHLILLITFPYNKLFKNEK